MALSYAIDIDRCMQNTIIVVFYKAIHIFIFVSDSFINISYRILKKMKIIRNSIAKLKKPNQQASQHEKSDDYVAGIISVPARSLLLPSFLFLSMRMHCF